MVHATWAGFSEIIDPAGSTMHLKTVYRVRVVCDPSLQRAYSSDFSAVEANFVADLRVLLVFVVPVRAVCRTGCGTQAIAPAKKCLNPGSPESVVVNDAFGRRAFRVAGAPGLDGDCENLAQFDQRRVCHGSSGFQCAAASCSSA